MLEQLLQRFFKVLFIFIVLSINCLVFAQGGSTTANIIGVIKDSQDIVVAAAMVKARNLETNLTRETTSNEDGSFALVALPPAIYEVTATADGFSSQTFRVELLLGSTSVADFKLQIGASSEVIEVRADDNSVVGKTESSTNIDRGRIDNLPINRRNFLDFTLLTPRAVKDRGPSQGVFASSGFSFNGQPSRSNNITIDGVDNNESATGAVRATFSQDAVQEFQVISDNFSAEFGRAVGGIVNIVTRGGGNTFRGSLFLLNRNDNTSAKDTFSPFKPPYKQYQFGGTFSGPIKQDKLFFFNSFERLSVKQSNFVAIGNQTVQSARSLGFALNNGPVPFALATTSVLSRVDARLSPNDTFFFRYNFGGIYNGAFEPFGGLLGDTNAGIQKLDDNSFSFNNTYINTGLNLVNETRFLYGRRNQNILSIDNGPQIRLLAPEGFTTFGRGTLLPQPRTANIYQIVSNTTITKGNQQIKFGVDYYKFNVLKEKSRLPIFGGGQAIFQPLDFAFLSGIPGLPTIQGPQNFDPTLRTPAERVFLSALSSALPQMFPGFPKGLPLADLSLPFAFIQGFGNPSADVKETQFSVFFQDDIKLRPNLLLKAGLRYDISRVKTFPDNNGNFSPRLSFSYRPEKLPKLHVHGGFGIFFGAPLAGNSVTVNLTSGGAIKILVLPFPFSVIPFSLPGHKFPDSNQLPANVTFTPQLSQTFTFEPNYRNGYTEQSSFGVDYLLGSNTVLSISASYVRGLKLFFIRNINPVVNPIPGSPVVSLVTGRRFPDKGDILEFESATSTYYYGGTVLLNRRFAQGFSLLAHYTFSKTIDNFGEGRFDQLEVGDPNNPGGERGLSLQDVRSRFIVSGTWQPQISRLPFTKNLLFSSIISLESGKPYNLLAGQDLDLNGDNPPNDRPASLGRNVGITPGFASCDLRTTYKAPIREGIELEVIGEVFNLFNRVNISEIDRTFPINSQGSFNLPTKQGGRYIAPPERYRGAFAPRQFQVGFRLKF